MKVDLHCSLPYSPLIPNPAIGYLKSLLLKNDIKTRNIYWNLILYNALLINYAYLSEKYQKLPNSFRYDYFTTHISTFLYEKNNKASSSSNSHHPGLIESSIPSEDLEKLSQELKNIIDHHIQQEKLYNSEIAGFTFKTSQWMLGYYTLSRLKHYNPNILTVIGGIESSSQAAEYLKVFKNADFAIWGEGEAPFTQLIERYDNPSSFNDIPNLAYRRDNKIITTDPINPKNLADINSYPFADHDDYFNIIKNYKFEFVAPIRIPIWGIRSCSWNKCTFCVLNEGYFYRERSPENITQEIEYQTTRHNVNHFIFVDNDFGRVKQEEFYKLLELLIESSNKIDKPYCIIGGISPFRMDRKSIEMMKKIGFDGVEMGFEATSDSLLKKLKKKQRFVQNIQALKLAEEQDFCLIDLNIIRHIPTETEEEVFECIKNLKFLRHFLAKYPFNYATLKLYKRSPLYEEMSEEERAEWDHSFYWHEMKKLKFLTEADRFEFFGFNRRYLLNPYPWELFREILENYQSNQFKYTWIGHPDGSSDIHEKSTTSLDKTETEILKFCDTIKTKTELKNNFPDLTEDSLKKIIKPLQDIGLIYSDKDFQEIISVVSSKYYTNKE